MKDLARSLVGAGDWSLATDAAWLDRMYAGPGVKVRFWESAVGELVAAASVRVDEALEPPVITVTALVRPGSERLFAEQSEWIDAAIREADLAITMPHPKRVVSEALTDAEVGRWRSLGFDLVFEELAMERDLLDADVTTATMWPEGTRVLDWSPESATASFAVYEAAFRERPGFPGWTRSEWIDHFTGGDEFLAAASCCALIEGRPAGFVVSDRAWINQIGVVPAFRRRGLASALVKEASVRMLSLGFSVVGLHVNTNNPAALAAWRGLGFHEVGRRGRFERRAS